MGGVKAAGFMVDSYCFHHITTYQAAYVTREEVKLLDCKKHWPAGLN